MPAHVFRALPGSISHSKRPESRKGGAGAVCGRRPYLVGCSQYSKTLWANGHVAPLGQCLPCSSD